MARLKIFQGSPEDEALVIHLLGAHGDVNAQLLVGRGLSAEAAETAVALVQAGLARAATEGGPFHLSSEVAHEPIFRAARQAGRRRLGLHERLARSVRPSESPLGMLELLVCAVLVLSAIVRSFAAADRVPEHVSLLWEHAFGWSWAGVGILGFGVAGLALVRRHRLRWPLQLLIPSALLAREPLTLLAVMALG